MNFEIIETSEKIKIFTTRPDTIFGASFIALSSDHPLSMKFKDNKEFLSFKEECNKSGTTEEALANTEKLGFNSNFFVKHPLSKIRKYQFTSQTLF